MFYSLLNLTEEQKFVYLRLLVFLAKSDNIVVKEEKDFIQQILLRFNLPSEKLKSLTIPQNIDEIYHMLKPINNRQIALDLIHCLWFATLADEHIADEEIEIVRAVAKFLNISDDVLMKLNDFVLDEINFLDRACKILETDKVF